jgi:hypothetical protein
VGHNALAGNPTGNWNVAVGSGAGQSLTTGQWNTFIGNCAGQFATTAVGTVSIGINAGQNSNASASVNIGNSAGASSGSSNIAIGDSALTSANSASTRNVALGTGASTIGSYCDSTVVGFNASRQSGGARNTVVGSCALYGNGSGAGVTSCCNTTLGYATLFNVSTGSSNVAVGHMTGCALTTGSQNVLIGPNVGTSCTIESCTLAIGYSNTALWLTGDSTKAIKPGAGIIDCANSCGTASQVLTSNGSNAIAWATLAAPATLTATKSLTNGTPVNLLSWSGGVRMGTLAVFATDNSTNVKWANVTIGSATGIGSSAVLTQSVGVGNFTITAGGGGETILTLTPSATIASVNFVYQYSSAFGAQPSVL